MKVGFIGAGNVGGTAAFATILRDTVASEIVIIDANTKLATAQAQDILDGTAFTSPCRVIRGDYKDLVDARIVVLAAGVNQRPGETRLDLLHRNAAVFRDIVPKVLEHCRPIFLIATNPVDVMTWITARITGEPSKVIGSGTILDTARFRAHLSTHLGLSIQSIHAYVLGEHGDLEVLCWSAASVGSIPIAMAAHSLKRPIDSAVRKRIDGEVRRAAYAIIDGKGATWFGIAAGIARIIQAIGADERALLTVSACSTDSDGALQEAYSLPRVIGANGILHTLEPQLDLEERSSLEASRQVLCRVIEQLRV